MSEIQHQGVGRAMLPQKALGTTCSMPLSASWGCEQCLVSLGLWTHPSSLCPFFTWVPTSVSASLVTRTLVTWVSVQPNDIILTGLHLQRAYFQMRSHWQVPGIRKSIYLLGEHNSTRTSVYWHENGHRGCIMSTSIICFRQWPQRQKKFCVRRRWCFWKWRFKLCLFWFLYLLVQIKIH